MIIHFMHSLLHANGASRGGAADSFMRTVGLKVGATKIHVDKFTERVVDDVCERTEGFSGREMSKLAIAWQAAAYGSEPAVLTEQVLHEVVDQHVAQKAIKQAWSESEREAQSLTMADITAAVPESQSPSPSLCPA